jgi:hypothetical protein
MPAVPVLKISSVLLYPVVMADPYPLDCPPKYMKPPNGTFILPLTLSVVFGLAVPMPTLTPVGEYQTPLPLVFQGVVWPPQGSGQTPAVQITATMAADALTCFANEAHVSITVRHADIFVLPFSRLGSSQVFA